MSISNISTKDNKRKLEKILGNELGHFRYSSSKLSGMFVISQSVALRQYCK
jgi:hypothetical protein